MRRGRGDDEGFAILRFFVTAAGKRVHLLNPLILIFFSELHGPLLFIIFINRRNIITNLNSLF